MFQTIKGIPIIPDKYAPEFIYVRAPRLPASKSRRIRKKWMKRYPQTRQERAGCWQTPMGIVGHPNNIERWLKTLGI